MDDLFNTQPNYSQAQIVNLREMERRSNDRIRVYNPTKDDFVVYWDSEGFRIPNRGKDMGQGNGQRVIPRYVAENYVKYMADKILGQRMVDAIVAENKRREAVGMATMTNWQDRVQFDTQFRIDNKQLRGDLITKILWLGIEEEYGLDDQLQITETKSDNRSVDEQILSSAQLNRPAQVLNGDLPTVDSLLTPQDPSPADPPADPPAAPQQPPAQEPGDTGMEQLIANG